MKARLWSDQKLNLYNQWNSLPGKVWKIWRQICCCWMGKCVAVWRWERIGEVNSTLVLPLSIIYLLLWGKWGRQIKVEIPGPARRRYFFYYEIKTFPIYLTNNYQCINANTLSKNMICQFGTLYYIFFFFFFCIGYRQGFLIF